MSLNHCIHRRRRLFLLLLFLLQPFGIMTWNSGHDDADQTLDDYLEFGEKHPALGFVLVIGLASLAGIPPLAGFIGKLLLFMAAWKAGLTTLCLLYTSDAADE